MASTVELRLYNQIGDQIQRFLALRKRHESTLEFPSGRSMKVWRLDGITINDRDVFISEDGNLYVYGNATYEVRYKFLFLSTVSEYENSGWYVCGTGVEQLRLSIASLQTVLKYIQLKIQKHGE